jgi:cyclophilin family peptidyl-prolyl cis-trans isomerase
MKCWRLIPLLAVTFLGLASGFAGTIVRFSTAYGNIDFELYDADKPITVQNFLSYVNGGSYTDMFMHRVVTNFVVQGGGFTVTNRGTLNAQHAAVVVSAPITNEFAVGPFYSNVYGTIAMAKTSDPNSATSQFFFNLADNSASLDDTNNSGGFTVFGHMIAGANVLDVFKIGPTNRVIKVSNQGDPFSELPVRYSARPTRITYDDLIYVDVIASPTYSPEKAVYTGLITSPGTPPGAGTFSLATTATGKFTGSMRIGSARYSMSGTLDGHGSANVTAKFGTASSQVSLLIDTNSGIERMTGTVTVNGSEQNLVAYRSPFDGRTNLATAFAGKYTMIIPGSDLAGAPYGDGFASISVDVSGKVKVTGVLGDGSAFTEIVPVSQDGHWPLFGSLYGGLGTISGWIDFTNRPAGVDTQGDDLNGSVTWLKPAIAKPGLFPSGFTTTASATGSRYNSPAIGSPALNLTDGSIIFSGGDLAASVTNLISLTAANKFTITGSNSVAITLTSTTGLIKGTFKAPGSTRSVPFKGAVLQNQNSGFGYYLGADQSGRVEFGP